MPLPTFPLDQTGKPQLGTSGNTFKKQVRTDFEGGYAQSRAQHTRKRRRHQLKWNGMTSAQFDALETFFDTYQGGSFTFDHAHFGDLECRFSDDQIEHEFLGAGLVKASVNIEEV